MARSRVRVARVSAELEGAAGHVRYEVEMLIGSADSLLYRRALSGVPPGIFLNMALESFLLHYRNLRAFLCPSLQPSSGDDILAADFLGTRSASDFSDAKTFSVDQQRINRMLAHISYGRDEYLNADNHRWDIKSMSLAILSEFQRFLAVLPPERSIWFVETHTLLAASPAVLRAFELAKKPAMFSDITPLNSTDFELLAALSLSDLRSVSEDDRGLSRLVEGGLAARISDFDVTPASETSGACVITLPGQLLATRRKYRLRQR